MQHNFKSWMKEVNRLCIKTIGFGTRDLEDYSWMSNFEDELSPGVSLYYFFEENGYVRRYPEVFEQFVEESEIV